MTIKELSKRQKELDNDIKTWLQTTLKQFIQNPNSFPNKEINSDIYNIYIPYEKLQDYLTSFGYEEDESSWETNGWQCDYWVAWETPEITLHIHGTLYNGRFRFTL